MVCDCYNAKLIWSHLIDNGIGKSPQDIATRGAPKNCPEHWVLKHQIDCSLHLSYECAKI